MTFSWRFCDVFVDIESVVRQKSDLIRKWGTLFRIFNLEESGGASLVNQSRESSLKGKDKYSWPPVLSSWDLMLFILKLYFSFLQNNYYWGGQMYSAFHFSKVSLINLYPSVHSNLSCIYTLKLSSRKWQLQR